MPLPTVTAGVPTTLVLGQWNTLLDSFVAHPSSPTGATINLNDGTTWSLVDAGSSGFGEGLELDNPAPTLYDTGNPRTVGRSVTRRAYDSNRTLKAHLMLVQQSSWSAFETALHNLAATLEGITTSQPAALQLKVVQSSTNVYADVVEAHFSKGNPGYKETLWNQLLDDGITIEFTCRPFLRGARQTLSNLIPNPGFGAPFGGGIVTTPPNVFADPFANVNAYTSIAGSAPTTGPSNTYVDVVLANGGANLLRYYRLDEASGTSAYDIAGTGATGTTHGSPTQGVTGLISGDTDTCYTFASASSQYVDCPTTGLPTGNGALTIGAWVKFASNPGSNSEFLAYGSNAGGNHNGLEMWITSGGAPECGCFGVGFVTGTALTTGVAHFIAATWDGTTLRLYADGASVGTPTTPGANTIPTSSLALHIGANALTSPASFFSGQIDEVCVWNTNLSSTQISNIYTAGHSGATGTLTNAMSVPSGATIGFGSPAWGAMQTWQVRLKYVTSLTATFFLHRTDANNYLAAVLTGTALTFNQVVAGTTHQVATAALSQLTYEAYYWLQVVQFPSVSGNVPYITATLFYDANGAVGSQVASASIAGATNDAVTALAGTAAIAASGAALVLGGEGNSAGAGQQIAVFGPGGWSFANSGTGVAAGAWDGGAAGAPTSVNTPGTNSATLGLTNSGNGGLVQVPVTSIGSARVDAPPTGGWSAAWQFGDATSLSTLQQRGVPVAAAGDVLGFTGALRATGNGSGYSASLTVVEYNASGSQVTSTSHTIASGAGSLSTWSAWQWTLTTQGTTAFAVVKLAAADAGSTSASSTTWWDNISCWDQTSTGMSTMPYCELRFGNSPAQFLVSGIVGDVPAPATVDLGTYLSSWAPTATLTYALGRRAVSTSNATLAISATSSPTGNYPCTLDSSSYGGYYVQEPAAASTMYAYGQVGTIANYLGTYRLWNRFYTSESTPNLGNVQVYTNMQVAGDGNWNANGVLGTPLTSGAAWNVVDTGQCFGSPATLPGRTDPSQLHLNVTAFWNDTNGGSPTLRCNWLLLLPVDADIVSGTVYNPSASGVTVTNKYLWTYLDGSAAIVGNLGAVAWNTIPSALPKIATAVAGSGTSSLNAIYIICTSAPYVSVDPTLSVNGVCGINILGGFMADNSADVLPCLAEVSYSPLYLFPL